MKNFLSTIIIGSLAMLGSFGFVGGVEAAQQDYCVIEGKKMIEKGGGFTCEPQIFPIPMGTNQTGATDSKTININKNTCNTSLLATHGVPIKYELFSTQIAKKCGATFTVSPKICEIKAGEVTNCKDGTQFCKGYSKTECKAATFCIMEDANCIYRETPPPPEKYDPKKAEGATPAKNIICSSVLEKIKSKCAGSPDFCRSECNQYNKCIYFKSKCEERTNLTQEELRSISIEAADSYLEKKYPVPDGYLSKILPPCAFHGTCRSLDKLLILGINIAKYLFGLIGTIAFAMFIYGGTRMMLSGGGSAGIQAGKDAMLHAVIGLIISFSSYLIVAFVLNMLQVGSDFRAIGLIIKYFV